MIDCLMLRSIPILRKPLLTEGVRFLRIEAGFFYIYAREAHAAGDQLVCFLVGIAETGS